MTNEEAKSRINTLLEVGGCDGFDYKDIKALEMAIKALEQTDLNPSYNGVKSELEQTRWIPVSERLPKYEEDIIITHKGIMGQPITSVSYFDGDFRTEDGEGYFSDVIAWMPFPEPYTIAPTIIEVQKH